jgi:hypothetical protein
MPVLRIEFDPVEIEAIVEQTRRKVIESQKQQPRCDTLLDRCAEDEDLMDYSVDITDFPSLQHRKKTRLDTYPVRLSIKQIEALKDLKRKYKIVPAEFIRDAIDSALRRIHHNEEAS